MTNSKIGTMPEENSNSKATPTSFKSLKMFLIFGCGAILLLFLIGIIVFFILIDEDYSSGHETGIFRKGEKSN